eukprot:6190717-Pleurochrysis_carterae.AAC.2
MAAADAQSLVDVDPRYRASRIGTGWRSAQLTRKVTKGMLTEKPAGWPLEAFIRSRVIQFYFEKRQTADDIIFTQS